MLRPLYEWCVRWSKTKSISLLFLRTHTHTHSHTDRRFQAARRTHTSQSFESRASCVSSALSAFSTCAHSFGAHTLLLALARFCVAESVVPHLLCILYTISSLVPQFPVFDIVELRSFFSSLSLIVSICSVLSSRLQHRLDCIGKCPSFFSTSSVEFWTSLPCVDST